MPQGSEKHVCPTTEKDQVKAIVKYLKAIQKMDIEIPKNPTDEDKKKLREGLLPLCWKRCVKGACTGRGLLLVCTTKGRSVTLPTSSLTLGVMMIVSFVLEHV